MAPSNAAPEDSIRIWCSKTITKKYRMFYFHSFEVGKFCSWTRYLLLNADKCAVYESTLTVLKHFLPLSIWTCRLLIWDCNRVYTFTLEMIPADRWNLSIKITVRWKEHLDWKSTFKETKCLKEFIFDEYPSCIKSTNTICSNCFLWIQSMSTSNHTLNLSWIGILLLTWVSFVSLIVSMVQKEVRIFEREAWENDGKSVAIARAYTLAIWTMIFSLTVSSYGFWRGGLSNTRKQTLDIVFSGGASACGSLSFA